MFQQTINAAGHGELHALTEAAFGRVKPLGKAISAGADESRVGQLRVEHWRRQLLEGIGQLVRLAGQFFAFFVIRLEQAHEQICEPWLAVLGLCWEVGAGKKRQQGMRV